MKDTGSLIPGKRHILVEPRLDGKTLNTRVKVSRDLRRYFRKDRFFIRYEQEINAGQGTLSIPAVALLLPLAWLTGSRLQVRCLDRTFAAAVEALQTEYSRIYPKIAFGTELIVGELTDSPPNPEGTAMLFSGGLDATYSFFANRHLEPRLIGVFGTEFPLDNEPYLESVRRESASFANRNKVALSFIHTNVPFLFDHRAGIHKFAAVRGKVNGDLWKGMGYALGFLSMTAPLSAGRFNHLIIAAWADRETARNVRENPDASSPRVDEKVAWSNLRVEHHGCLHRYEKAREMRDWLPGNQVRVCWKFEKAQELGDAVNCSRCEKCARTIVALAIGGVDPRLCGFRIDEESIRYIRDRLEKGRSSRSHLSKWWEPMQRQLPDHIEGDMFGLREFMKWFRSYDLGAVVYSPGLSRRAQKVYHRLPYGVAVAVRSLVYKLIGEPYWLNRPEPEESPNGRGSEPLRNGREV
jgi:hypothetical protein